VILPAVARDQSINMNTNEHRENANGDNETHDFSLEVHVLAGTLVPIVSTTHLVVRELIGTTPSPH
jgi:hypothetical protein